MSGRCQPRLMAWAVMSTECRAGQSAYRPGRPARVDCGTCEKTALGACRFCGRGACREHAQVRPFIVGLYRGKPDELVKAVVVEDALHCGVCHPRGEPVPLPELE